LGGAESDAAVVTARPDSNRYPHRDTAAPQYATGRSRRVPIIIRKHVFFASNSWVFILGDVMEQKLIRALSFFLDDERFQIHVGGNPNAVDAMLAEAQKTYREAIGIPPTDREPVNLITIPAMEVEG